MIYRLRLCRDGLWYVQQKRARGLEGGIWKRIGIGCLTELAARYWFTTLNV